MFHVKLHLTKGLFVMYLIPMKEQKLRAVEFSAYIPPLQSAITFGDDSARVKIDIPIECREQAKALIDFQGKELRIVVEVMDE